MQFLNNTLISPDMMANNIPIIHGKNYYIDEQTIVCTYNKSSQTVISNTGTTVSNIANINQITENIFVIDGYLSFQLASGEILKTSISASKSVYKGGFQGIVGFNTGEASYQFLNNTCVKSVVSFTARINSSLHMEIQLGSDWYVPNGEFRVYIEDTFYNISSETLLPNTFGDTFTVYLASWTNVSLTDTTDYIKDALVQGNTLYLSTRKHLIGSAPYSWEVADEETSSTVWSTDSRLIYAQLEGEPSADHFFAVNNNTNTVYYLDNSTLNISNSYQHQYDITAACNIDKQFICLVDKRFITLVNFYTQLSSILFKIVMQYEFKQMSAYEDLPNYEFTEEVKFSKAINTIGIKSSYRNSMLIYIINNKVSSICYTDQTIILTPWTFFNLDNKTLTKYSLVEDNGRYAEITDDNPTFESYIYIGSDLEPQEGGSTLSDTNILFEGKIAIDTGDDYISIESSGDTPNDTNDLPVRTNQSLPTNNWYLYSKLLTYPVSYTDWFKITLMPTTRIYQISLKQLTNSTNKKKK